MDLCRFWFDHHVFFPGDHFCDHAAGPDGAAIDADIDRGQMRMPVETRLHAFDDIDIRAGANRLAAKQLQGRADLLDIFLLSLSVHLIIQVNVISCC